MTLMYDLRAETHLFTDILSMILNKMPPFLIQLLREIWLEQNDASMLQQLGVKLFVVLATVVNSHSQCRSYKCTSTVPVSPHLP